jgi:hypothetical protein
MPGFIRGQEIALAEAVKVAAVERKEPQPPVQGFQLIQVEREQEDPMDKPVRPG